MKLVVGLGNPGRRYAATRHNVGFRVVDHFAAQHRIEIASRRFGGEFGRGRLGALDVGILKPQDYMNLSGAAVAEALRFLPVADVTSDLLVVSDDVDLPFGRLRMRRGGGDGGHRGLRDLIDRLARRDFARLRFGVGRPTRVMNTTDHVLQRLSSEEEALLSERLEEASRAIEAFLFDGIEAAMNHFNRTPEPDAPSE